MILILPFACMSPVVSMLSRELETIALMEEASSASIRTWLAPFVLGTTRTLRGAQTKMVSNMSRCFVVVAAQQLMQQVAKRMKITDFERV